MRNYQNQFPDFAGVQLPELPADFEDVSWGNDASPHWWSKSRRLAVWFRHPDITLREDPFLDGLYLIECTDATGYSEGEHVLYEGDSWQRVLEIIAERRS